MTNKNGIKRVPTTPTEKRVYEMLSQGPTQGLTVQSRMSSDPRNLQANQISQSLDALKQSPSDQSAGHKQQPAPLKEQFLPSAKEQYAPPPKAAQAASQAQASAPNEAARASPGQDKRFRPPQHSSADHSRRVRSDVRRPVERKAAVKQHVMVADTFEDVTKLWSPARHPHYKRYEPEFCSTVRAVLLAHHRCATWTRYGLALVGDGTTTNSLGSLPIDVVFNILAFVAPPGHKNSVVSLALAPDSCTLVSASCDNTLKLWDVQTGELLRTLEGHGNSVKCLAISPDGQYVVSGAQDNTIKVWLLSTGELHKTLSLGLSRNAMGLAVTADNRIISVSSDRVINKWDIEFGDLIYAYKEESGVYCATIAPDGERVVIGSCDGSVRLHDLDTGKLSDLFKGHKGSVYSVAVTPDGRAIVSGSADHAMHIRDFNTGELMRTLKVHSSVVSSIAITKDGRHVVSSSADKTIKVSDLATGEVKHTIQGFAIQVNSVVVTADGLKIIACSSFDNTIKMWSSAS